MPNINLINQFKRLGKGSREAVDSGNGLRDLSKYLNVDRPIQEIIRQKLDAIDQEGGGILLLVGSAGDGKSYLISQLREEYEERGFSLINDATESTSPNKTEIETLKEERLSEFTDAHLLNTNKKLMIAINLGVLVNFCADNEVQNNYKQIVNVTTPLCTDSMEPIQETNKIKVVSFTDYQLFNLDLDSNDEIPLNAPFLEEILRKIVARNLNNPFYNEIRSYYNSDNDDCPTNLNYLLLTNGRIRKAIVNLVIEASIRYKLNLTPREYLDFLCSILVHPSLGTTRRINFFEASLPSLLFNGKENLLQKHISKLDPLKNSSTEHDRLLGVLFAQSQFDNNIFRENNTNLLSSDTNYSVQNAHLENIVPEIINYKYQHGESHEEIAKFLFRIKCMINYSSQESNYISFLRDLKGYYKNDGQIINGIASLVKNNITHHFGIYQNMSNHIPIHYLRGDKYTLFSEVQFEDITDGGMFDRNNPDKFRPELRLQWRINDDDHKIMNIKIDYPLYEYLKNLSEGKLSISSERNKNLEMSRLVRTLEKNSKSNRNIYITSYDEGDKILSKNMRGIIRLENNIAR